MFHMKSNDGTKIAVYVYNPHGEKTVVMVHGWPLSAKIYEYQLKMLIDSNFRVVTLDLRGFGNSDVPACTYTYDQMAADLYYVIQNLGIKKFTLVGFSMGGAIVLRYMRLFRSYGVEKLILLAAAAPKWTKGVGYPFGHTKSYVNSLIDLAMEDRPLLAENFSCQLFHSPQSKAAVDWFRDIALSASGIGTVETAISLRDEDGRIDLSHVKVPTTIIHGQMDEVVSNDLAMIQHKAINSSKLYNLENSGHGIMYDELKQFNRIFLSEVKSIDC